LTLFEQKIRGCTILVVKDDGDGFENGMNERKGEYDKNI